MLHTLKTFARRSSVLLLFLVAFGTAGCDAGSLTAAEAPESTLTGGGGPGDPPPRNL